jgi:Tol biopolymer transport system component
MSAGARILPLLPLLWGCAAASAPVDTGVTLPAGALRLLEELGPPVISTLDPQTSAKEAWFSVASGGFAYELDAGEGGDVTLAYTPPAAEGESGYDRSRIVRITPDGVVEPVACRDAKGVWCFYPAVAPDSARTWFVIEGDEVASGAAHALAYVDAAGDTPHEAVAMGTEPAISPDGAHVAWVAIDPDTLRRSLVVGDADGAVERVLLGSGVVTDISSPFFSADGTWLYFVVPTVSVSMLDWIVPGALAHGNHDVAADWWRVPTAGGEVEQVTHLETIQYDGRAHPDGRWFAAATREGVLVVDGETGGATSVLAARTIRALAWVR